MTLTPRLLMDAASAGDGKKYTKVVTNPKTGRKNKVRYGAKGYTIAPGTDKGDRYCARSFGDMKSEGYNCSGAERNTPLCLSRAKWKCSGKTSRRDAVLTPRTVLGYRRNDAPEGDKGKPCGESFIPQQYRCRKKAGFLTPTSLRTAAKVAVGVGLVAGGITIARKWNADDDHSFQEALSAGKKWDVYERKRVEDDLDPEVAELRAERQARRERFCGRTDSGKTQAERSDVFKTCARQIGEQSAYGQLYIHPDRKRLFKVPVGNQKYRISQQEAVETSYNEFQHLVQARRAGVRVPAPISIHPRSGVLQMEYIPNSMTLRDFNKTNNSPLRQYKVSVSLLDQARRLHRAGISHNDLHPGNVLVTPGRSVVLIDFGLAQSLRHSDRAEALFSINAELSKVLTRVDNIHKGPTYRPEIENWLILKHRVFLRSLELGTTSDEQLAQNVDIWYADLRKALKWKVARPNSILGPNTIL